MTQIHRPPPFEQFWDLAFALAAALDNLLDDTQHDHHPDCPEGPCPVRDARTVMARWRAHYPRHNDDGAHG